jgi:hypothetical protein
MFEAPVENLSDGEEKNNHETEQTSVACETPAQLTELSPLAIIHWFCVQKDISVSDEKVLLRLLAHPIFNINPNNLPFNKVQQELKSGIPTIGFSSILCRKKGKKEMNIKPINTDMFSGTATVNVYNVHDHLKIFLANEKLANSLIFKPVSNTVGYSSFVSGEYFHTVVRELPVGQLPLCRMFQFTIEVP